MGWALNATSSPEVQAAVSKSLQLVDTEVVSCSLNRLNIFYSISPTKSCSVSIHCFYHTLLVSTFHSL